MNIRRFLRHVDYLLLAATLGLVGYGATIIYYATRHDPGVASTFFLTRQLAYVGVGLVALVVVAAVDYEHFRRWQWVFYLAAVGSIAAVFFLGPITRGSRRWIDLGFIAFQPSEIAIWLIALSLGAFLVDRLDSLGSRRLSAVALAYVAVPALTVFRQPDLGTATVLMALGLGLLFFFGTRWTHFAVIGAGLVAAMVLVLAVLPAMNVHLIKSYQMARLTVFLDPGQDSTAAGYNLEQSIIAIGSGGLSGRGDLATQTQLQFLPEHHTDFIFAVAGERWGFLGVAVVICLYAVFIWRALRITAMARDMYGSVVAGGISAAILYQVLVNVGMTVGIMPVTGIPLPFVSYGGAALITNLMLVGLLQSVHVRASEAIVMRSKVVQT